MDRYDSAGLSDVSLIDKRPPVLTIKGVNDLGETKYHLDLHEANRRNMLLAGIPNENIYETDVCTCCNPDLLFSHRASKGKRGGLCGYLGIKEN